jgi:hypothetical protein
MIEQIWPLVTVALTSAAVAAAGLLGFRRPLAGLRPAATRLLEVAGWTLVLLVANLVVGTVSALGWRALTGSFVSVYANADLAVVVLSLVQAIVCQEWLRPRSAGGQSPPPA